MSMATQPKTTAALESAAKELVHAAFAENPVLASSPEVVAELKGVNVELASLKTSLKEAMLELKKSAKDLKDAVLELKDSSKVNAESIIAALKESSKVQKIQFGMSNADQITHFPVDIRFKVKNKEFQLHESGYNSNQPQLGFLIQDVLRYFLKGNGIYLNCYDMSGNYNYNANQQLSKNKAAQNALVEAIHGLTGHKPCIKEFGDNKEPAIFWQ
mmetsp:Transcript_28804/g.92764  ORF Transcript_28804/g.92764 Transcript_28804/m.92764 type:complete len:215 (+) Transcript_28804:71-715(+)